MLVCDGFVGNVPLKSMEGVALTLFAEIKHAIIAGVLKRNWCSVAEGHVEGPESKLITRIWRFAAAGHQRRLH